MSGFLGKPLTGIFLSISIHGAVACLAALSFIQVRVGGGNGGGAGADSGDGESFSVLLRGERAPMFSGVERDETVFARAMFEEPSWETSKPVEIGFDPGVFHAESTRARSAPQDRDQSRDVSCDVRRSWPAGFQGGSGAPGGAGQGQGMGVGDGPGKAYMPPPVYPASARRRGIEGWVIVEVAIHADGTCEVEQIVNSSGDPAFEEAVVRAVQSWRYQSSALLDRPLPTSERFRFVFKLAS